MFSRRFAAALGTLAVLAPVADVGAQTTTMDFSGLGLANRAIVGSTAGSSAMLDIMNATVRTFGDAALADCGPGNPGAQVRLWAAPGADAAAFACRDASVSQYYLAPAAGQRVFLNGLVLASAANGLARGYSVRVFDAADWTTALFSTDGTLSSPTSLDVNVSSARGLYLQVGSTRNIGVSEIATTVSPIVVTAAPEPATLLLLAPGLAAVAAAGRRRRARA